MLGFCFKSVIMPAESATSATDATSANNCGNCDDYDDYDDYNRETSICLRCMPVI